MTKEALLAFWASAEGKDKVFFHTRFKQWLDQQPDSPPEAKNATESDEDRKTGTWTDNQREAFHVGCTELANYFTAHGLDMKAVLKHDVDIPWTKDTVKEFIFRPIMKAMYGYDSHTQLKKGEVSPLWDVAMKHLGERRYTNSEGDVVVVEYMEFPNDKHKTEVASMRKSTAKLPEYPVDEFPGGPTF